MLTSIANVVEIAIRGWPETLRLCVIILVAATITLYVYVMGIPALPVSMR